VWIDAGSATLYAGHPDAVSHRALVSLVAGEFYDVTELAEGEILSVQSAAEFTYQVDVWPEPPPPVGLASPLVTWTCTGADCPWGSPLAGYALEWPAAALPTTQRLGYTTSHGVYLPAIRANGTEIRITVGTASVYAGEPDAGSHRLLATLSEGSAYVVSGVLAGEVISVQSGSEFLHETSVAPPGVPEEPPPPGPGPGEPGATSQLIVWSCTSTPCPWGAELSGHAQVWPTTAASNSRLGYTTSGAIYLPSYLANGTRLLLESGAASLYAGLPDAGAHRFIGTLTAGVEFEVSGLEAGEVLSVQNDSAFSVAVTLGTGQPPNPPPPPPTDVFYSIPALWRCDIEGCSGNDWTGSVINWPSWAAYPNNNRAGDQSRTVYSESGEMLYPYMGSWAHGCEVTAYMGNVLIIEWQRGTEAWRETYLAPGETHTIQLIAPEDGAMIETDGSYNDFAVRLNNCTPQPLPWRYRCRRRRAGRGARGRAPTLAEGARRRGRAAHGAAWDTAMQGLAARRAAGSPS
jgi:hypothetical protein